MPFLKTLVEKLVLPVIAQTTANVLSTLVIDKVRSAQEERKRRKEEEEKGRPP